MNMHKHFGLDTIMVSTLVLAMGLVACGDDSSTSSEHNESVKLETDLADGNKVVCDDDTEGVVAVTADAGYRKCEDGRWVEISEDEALSADKIIGAVEDKSSSSEKGNSSSSEKASSSSSVIPSGSEGSSSSKGKSSSSSEKAGSSSSEKAGSSSSVIPSGSEGSSSSKGKSSSSSEKGNSSSSEKAGSSSSVIPSGSEGSSSKDESSSSVMSGSEGSSSKDESSSSVMSGSEGSSSSKDESSSSEDESSSSVMSSSEEEDPSTLYQCDADGLLYENPENCPSYNEGSSSSSTPASSADATPDTDLESSSSSSDKPAWQYLNPDIEYGELIDTRDDQVYKTITIGEGDKAQTWMAENLNYSVEGQSWCGGGTPETQNEGDCSLYGHLYTWHAALQACPEGWHLPSQAEWEALYTAVGGEAVASKNLKANADLWLENTGSNASGFSILPAGERKPTAGDYDNWGKFANFWSSSLDKDDLYPWYQLFGDTDDNADQLQANDEYGFSVRCLKGVKPAWQYLNPDKTYGTITDTRDGQVYKTITIGEGNKAQTWMAENLNYSVEGQSWCGGGTPETQNEGDCSLYGRLYTWEAAVEACPEGWYLPSKAAWEALYTAVGGEAVAGKNLKANADLWLENTGSNSSGFSAIPAGKRNPTTDGYDDLGKFANFWSSTLEEVYPWYQYFGYTYDDAGQFKAIYVNDGFSVRCLKGSSFQGTDGKPVWQYLNPDKTYGEIYDTRDGQVYKTIKIGSQTWMAENLNYDPGDDVSSMSETAWSGCYEHEADSCAKYGRLYTWEVAMNDAACAPGKECKPSGNVQGVCPQGWHLPSKEEWQQLLKPLATSVEYGTLPNIYDKDNDTDYEFYLDAGGKLETVEGWAYSDTYPSTNATGFSGLPSGIRTSNAEFDDVDLVTYFWSASEYDGKLVYHHGLAADNPVLDVHHKEVGLSVRCLKD